MWPEIKRYLISSVYTFLTAFLVVILAMWGTLNTNVFDGAAWTGVLMAGLRAGIKLTGEFLLPLLIDVFRRQKN